MKQNCWILFVALFVSTSVYSQDTFSIVAVDSITGEVGSAGASCVDLTGFPGFSDDFLGELFPGTGAINTQAYYIQANQINARNRMNAGDTPEEIIDWLINNDVNNQPQFRQYGIVGLVDGMPQSAGHTGSSTDDYKNHILGPNYSIQGNILLGQEILDSMEARFLNEKGDLACKLMAALQGANVVGADTRCAPNGSSSLFAFVKVAQPDDVFGSPSFVQSVRTQNGANIEPIDSLQTLFDNVHNCSLVSTEDFTNEEIEIRVFPNPFTDRITIQNHGDGELHMVLWDARGKRIKRALIDESIEMNTSDLSKGIYYIKLSNDSNTIIQKVVKNH